jgi:membrane protease subunit (stomatin/prohibitin family)
MGFIKSIETAVTGQYEDQFKEVIKCDGLDTDLLMRKVTTYNGVIQDKSRLYVQPGQCAILVDNGAIKDIISEPGMYFMDTSAPTLFQTNIFKGIGSQFLEAMKRVAYQGEVINQQAIFFVSLTEKIGLSFQTEKPILYKDPTWGPIEISAKGEYIIKVNNPVNLLTNVTGDVGEYHVSQIYDSITPFILAGVATDIANAGVSFDEITAKQDQLGQMVIASTTEKLDSLGVEITKLTVSSIDVSEEVKKSMRERTDIKMKATSATDEEANIYTKLTQAQAMKDLANNTSGSPGQSIMGMKMGEMFGGQIQQGGQAVQTPEETPKSE